MSKILEVKNLVVESIDRNMPEQILKNVNFELNKSSSIAIIGESGSGKSVSVKAIAGLLNKGLKMKEGKIVLSGDDISSFESKKRRNLLVEEFGFIFQDPMSSLNPLYKIEHQIMEVFEKNSNMDHSQRVKRVYELLRLVRLKNSEIVAKKYPHQLSGGQRQRVMIAIAIANNPSILIADEPTTALDVTVQKRIVLLLKSLVKDNDMSMIFISHDLGLVKFVTDYIYIMYDGYILESGYTKDIFQNPKHPYTIGLINCMPDNVKRGQKIPTIEKPDLNSIVAESGKTFDIRDDIENYNVLEEMSELVEVEKNHFVRFYR